MRLTVDRSSQPMAWQVARTAGGWLTVAILVSPALAQAPPEKPSAAIVALADGTTVHLRDFRFIVEFASSAKGDPPTAATIERIPTKELWSGKKALPLAGSRLELHRTTIERPGETDADGRPVLISRLKDAALVEPNGRRTVVRLGPPDGSWLLKDRSRFAQARAIDIEGESLLGGRASYCLVSFTPLVECPGRPEFLVTQVTLTP